MLDALRQPLESGEVVLARAGGVVRYPCRFLLVLAANPCPCAAGGRDVDASGCVCPAALRRRYLARLSGPLRDRVDLTAVLGPVSRQVLDAGATGEPSERVRDRVVAARERAAYRLNGTPWAAWGDVPGPVARRRWPLPAELVAPLRTAVARQQLSTRGIDRVAKVAWTIADLSGRGRPTRDDVEEALGLRNGRRFAAEAVPA